MKLQKPTLLIFSQCYIYGGSERLMQSIYKNPYILDEYDIVYSYSYFKDYKIGLKRDIETHNLKTIFKPLYLLTNGDIFNKINLKLNNKPLRRLIKLPFFLIEMTGLYAIWNIIYFFIYLLILKPDVVHINNGGYPAAKACNQLALILNLFPSIKVIYQVNNKAIEKTNFISRNKDKWISRNISFFLTHSLENKIALIKRGFKETNVTNFPSYFNETILSSNLKPIDIRKGRFTLSMVGFLSFRKGQLFLLEALLEIKRLDYSVYCDIQLNFVGDGENKFILEDFIKKNNLTENVKLWGNRPDYIQFIKECDLYMLTSVEGEDLPLVLLTAMQYNRCIIASDFAGISEMLTHQFDAFLVKPNLSTIARDIANAIIYLYKNPEIRDAFSKNVAQTFIENLGEEKYAKNLLKLYNSK
jgi:glycosyltransferase involved in cell wall biosynthesis